MGAGDAMAADGDMVAADGAGAGGGVGGAAVHCSSMALPAVNSANFVAARLNNVERRQVITDGRHIHPVNAVATKRDRTCRFS